MERYDADAKERHTDAISALHWVAAQPNVPLDAPGVAPLVLGLAAAHILGVARLQIHRVAKALLGGSIPRGAAVFRNVRLSDAGHAV